MMIFTLTLKKILLAYRRMKLSINSYRLLFHASIALIVIFPWPLILPRSKDVHEVFISRLFSDYWLFFILVTIPFYFANTYFFVPRYLKHRKYLVYLFCVVASILIGGLIKTIFLYQVVPAEDFPLEFRGNIPIHLFPIILLFALGTSFEMILTWDSQGRREAVIEKEKISAELSFLKTQVNPHFLFNSLNNIYSLSEKKSERAGEAVLLLSNIMRYVLYDTNHGKMHLEKEINHLEDYIAMQRLRLSEKENISIRFSYSGDIKKVLIEPLLLIPFVENAFKHGISYDEPTVINIELSVSEETMVFHVSNTKKRNKEHGLPVHHVAGGIGIQNTKRRLELMYDQRFELKTEDHRDHFETSLVIQLGNEDRIG